MHWKKGPIKTTQRRKKKQPVKEEKKGFSPFSNSLFIRSILSLSHVFLSCLYPHFLCLSKLFFLFLLSTFFSLFSFFFSVLLSCFWRSVFIGCVAYFNDTIHLTPLTMCIWQFQLKGWIGACRYTIPTVVYYIRWLLICFHKCLHTIGKGLTLFILPEWTYQHFLLVFWCAQ